MIPFRRKPDPQRFIGSALEDKVPDFILAQMAVSERFATYTAQELELRDPELERERITVERLPDRKAFEQAFLSKRASNPTIQFDEATDRIYLVGLGLPGREELVLEERYVKNRYGDKVAKELVTLSVIREDTVLSFAEISWPEYREVCDLHDRLPPAVQTAVAKYFKTVPDSLLPVLASLPTLTEEDYYRIAGYVETMG
ncbi:MAG: hypothetical protein D6800_06755 [Candidatus Zixiibacteriota bacterium]|nr:MAG: hypothetical protein D6800_06755 [candidate division Zixibacteria bacterium]